MNGESRDKDPKEGAKAACATFVEQTKLLMSLASAFIVAPAAVQAFLKIQISGWIVAAEILFIVSVLISYAVLGSVAGSQNDGSFNVFRPATMRLGLLQFVTYFAGLICFGIWFVNQASTSQPTLEEPAVKIEVSR